MVKLPLDCTNAFWSKNKQAVINTQYVIVEA